MNEIKRHESWKCFESWSALKMHKCQFSFEKLFIMNNNYALCILFKKNPYFRWFYKHTWTTVHILKQLLKNYNLGELDPLTVYPASLLNSLLFLWSCWSVSSLCVWRCWCWVRRRYAEIPYLDPYRTGLPWICPGCTGPAWLPQRSAIEKRYREAL